MCVMCRIVEIGVAVAGCGLSQAALVSRGLFGGGVLEGERRSGERRAAVEVGRESADAAALLAL